MFVGVSVKSSFCVTDSEGYHTLLYIDDDDKTVIMSIEGDECSFEVDEAREIAKCLSNLADQVDAGQTRH